MTWRGKLNGGYILAVIRSPFDQEKICVFVTRALQPIYNDLICLKAVRPMDQ